jgi:hypothetical protein
MVSPLQKLIKETKNDRKTLTTIFGAGGIGKTTACAVKDSVWIQTEQGEGVLKLQAFDLVKKYEQVGECIDALLENDHDYKLLVIDSLDHLEPLMWDYVCEKSENKWKHIEEPGYGKGYVAALDEWRKLISKLNELRDTKAMHVCMIAHAAPRKVDQPDGTQFHVMDLKLHTKSSMFIAESCDCVFYAQPEIKTTTKDQGFGRKKTIGTNTGDRIMHSVGTPHFVAKNRFGLPEELPLSFTSYLVAMQKAKEQKNPTQKKEA